MSRSTAKAITTTTLRHQQRKKVFHAIQIDRTHLNDNINKVTEIRAFIKACICMTRKRSKKNPTKLSIKIALSQRKRINFQLQGKTKQMMTTLRPQSGSARLVQSQPFHLNRRNT